MSERAVRAPFLVLAHHRSGSNFLNDLLQSHPQIECLNEPLSMHTAFFRAHDLSVWRQEDFDDQQLHPCLARESSLRAYLLSLRDYLLQSGDSRVIGFKETVLFGKLEWLKSFLPSLKLILLQRDPRAVVSSVLRSALLGFWRYEDLVPPSYHALWPDAKLPPSHHAGEEVHAATIAAMSVAVRGELARRTAALFDGMTLSLEDLLGDPEAAMHSLAGLLGVEPHPAQLSFLQERQLVSRGGTFSSFRLREHVLDRWRSHLSAAQLDAIDRVFAAAHLPVPSSCGAAPAPAFTRAEGAHSG
ncbi:sulfotransferase [Schlegelella sp. S2-27]|uniref:Sulfotransferase n=1 Tax=Caldimonas mangrovi TaxID=2944811 RepID=A0ABT0YIA5_9BURK|nr:sulfotransferase [Caldimonas mangrovi]MCM5678457.1 sulfotransferase [Caldimonas mangrovi]